MRDVFLFSFASLTDEHVVNISAVPGNSRLTVASSYSNTGPTVTSGITKPCPDSDLSRKILWWRGGLISESQQHGEADLPTTSKKESEKNIFVLRKN